ncbi:hypothetical protein pb186bvf_009846 [Paramecium bursaria]
MRKWYTTQEWQQSRYLQKNERCEMFILFKLQVQLYNFVLTMFVSYGKQFYNQSINEFNVSEFIIINIICKEFQ